MFSFFRSTKDLSRFESCNELSLLPPIIHQLHQKCDELKEAATKYGNDSFDGYKYLLLSDYVEAIDEAINSFNFPPNKDDDDTIDADMNPEMRIINALKSDMDELVQKLKIIVNEIKTTDEDMKTLLRPRNSQRQMANTAVDITVTGGTILTACVMPLTYAAGTLAVVCASSGNQAARNITGLSDLRGRSGRLILELEDALVQTSLKLNPPLVRPI